MLKISRIRTRIGASPLASFGQNGPGYRRDIDGLRAIAVLAVVGFHAEIGILEGGFIGVDIFFVISGYLICGIVIRSLARERFSFVEFYVRRINRIFPALIVVLASVAVLGWTILFPPEFSALGKHMLAGAGFASNLLLWSETGYFVSQDKPLLHLWSLGVEEQFYLVWPLVLFVLRVTGIAVVVATLAFIVMSFVANIWLLDLSEANAAFYLPISRFWEILVGGLLATSILKRGNHNRAGREATLTQHAASLLGLAMLAASLASVSRNTVWPGYDALLPVLGTALIITAGQNAFANKLLLSRRILVWIGLISYPLYLWHWPLLVFARVVNEQQVPRAGRVGLVALSFALAAITYIAVERPIRSRGNTSRSAVRLIAAMAAVAVLAFAIYSDRVTPRLGGPYRALVEDIIEEGPGGFFDATGVPVFSVIRGDSTRTVVVLGDSHGSQYRPRFEKLANLLGPSFPQTVFFTYGGCPPYPDVNRPGISWDGTAFRCDAVYAAASRRALQPDVETVVISAYWEGYFEEFELFHVNDKAKSLIRYPGATAEGVLSGFEKFLEQLTLSGKRVFLVLPNPNARDFHPQSRLPRRLPGLSPRGVRDVVPIAEAYGRAEAIRRQLIELSNRHGVILVDPFRFLCTPVGCPAKDSAGQLIYRDNHHFRLSFARESATFIDAVLAR